MAGVRPRIVASASPRLFPGERLMFSKQDVWYLYYTVASWQIGTSMTAFPVRIFFHVTNMRALSIFRNCGILDMELSQWRKDTSLPQSSEHITDIRLGSNHFGTVRFDFWGLGRGRFGIGRTPFGKEGGDVPYLEVTSRLPGNARFRTVKIFMGVGKEADEALETAYNILHQDFQEE